MQGEKLKDIEFLIADKDIDYKKINFTASYHFLDFSIRIATKNYSLYKIASQQFSCLKLDRRKDKPNPDIDIFLAYVSKKIEIPKAFNKIGEVSNRFCLSHCYKKENSVIYTTNRNSVLFGEPYKGRFSILINSANQINADLYATFFFILIVLSLKFKGLFALHSALMSKENAGILFTGDSGTGKTTLAVNLTDRDFRYICDDTCLLYRMGYRKVGAFALPKLFFPPNNKQGFQNQPSLNSNFRGYKKPPSIFTAAHTKTCIPKFIIFLQITRSKKSEVTHISKNEAMIKLIKLSQLIATEEKEMFVKHLQLLKDLSEQCRCFNLLAGKDIKESPDKAKNILRHLIE